MENKRLKAVNNIDRQLLELLNQRLELVRQDESAPGDSDSLIVKKAQQQKMATELAAVNTGRLSDNQLQRIFSEIIDATLPTRDAATISYLGPEATFTHVAALEYFDQDDNFIPLPGIRDVFEEVEKGACDYGVVPVENSIEGSVNHTLDLFLESNLKICGEKYLVIAHDLLSITGKKEHIKTIYSHPQSFAQCRGWLEKNLPEAELVECSSNAQAARQAGNLPEAAAIAGSQAASLYDLQVVAPKIQDFARNTTRFLIIGRNDINPSGHDKTSLMFVTAHVPGALFKVLEPISKSDLNMLKLESRPAKYENWSYVFFVDLEGHRQDEQVKNTLAKMKDVCQFLKILGSYPMVTSE